MKQLHKHPFRRTVALLLTVCCLLSLAAPTVFAETSGNTAVAQTFKFHNYGTANTTYAINGTSNYRDAQVFTPTVTEGDGQWSFVGRSMGSYDKGEGEYGDLAKLNINKSSSGYSSVYFKNASVADGSWVAFRLENVTAGAYDFTLTTKTNTGKADVYIMPASSYSTVATAYSQYDANNAETVTAISDAMKTLLAGIDAGTVTNAKKFDTVFDSTADTDAPQKLGSYTASENGSYVLVFRCAADGAGTVNIKTLSMTASQETEEPGNTAVAQSFKFHNYGTTNITYAINGTSDYKDAQTFTPTVTEGDGQWSFVGRSMGSYDKGEGEYGDLAKLNINKSSAGYSSAYFKTESAADGSWVAFRLENVTAGAYDFALTTKQNNGGGRADVYIMPASAYSSVATAYSQYDASNAATVTAISDAMKTLLAGIDAGTVTNAKKFDTVFETRNATTDELQNLGSYTASENGSYVLVFRCAAEGDVGTVNIKTLSITPSQENQGGGSAGNPLETIIDHTTLIEATAYEIEHGQNDFFTTSEVNGHDYLYLPHNSVMFVYDLDTWTKVDEEEIGFSETDGVFVDSTGIVWVHGSGKNLYRYNPVDGTGQAITINPINKEFADEYTGSIGEPVEVDGKIYFGTYPNARLYALDMQTLAYEDLGTMDPDGVYVWNMAYKDGYLYAAVQAANKNSLPQKIVKYSIDGKNVVDSIDLEAEDIADLAYVSARNFDDIIVVDNMLLFTSMSPNNMLAIDISGEKMRIDPDVKALNGAHNGFSDIVVEADGSQTVYFFAYTGERYKDEELGVFINTLELWKYNSSSGTSKVDGFERVQENLGLASRGDTFVTIKNEEMGLDGTYLITVHLNGSVSLYDLENKKVHSRLGGLTDGDGAPINAIYVASGHEGSNKLYVGYYMNKNIGEFDITTNTVTNHIPVYSDQTERILCHDGTCYVATYGACAISEVNVDTGEVNNLFQLNKGNSYYIIAQERLRNLVVADNKIFASTVPHKSILGGFITWYDYDTQNVYVAVEPEKVIYAKAADTFNETTVWRDVKTNEEVVPNLDDAGNHDYTGLIDGQVVTSLVYKDGYLYGTTNINGGSGADPKEGASAMVFVYDVENMKLVATCDLREKIDGLADPIVYLAGVWADPDVEGKFWGVASQTLYSFTFDLETKTFDVQERLSYGKETYKGVNSEYHSWPVYFVDGYMFINFRAKDASGNPVCQFRIVSTDDPTYNVKFSNYSYQEFVLGEDNNVYALIGDSTIVKLETAELFNQLKAAKPAYDQEKAAAAKAKIDSIGTVTLNSEAAIADARAAYNALSVTQKQLVDPAALLAAETELAALKAAEKAAADQAAADAVKAKITAIGEVSLNSKEAIDAARAAYDDLTAEQKALVDVTALTAAERKLEELKAAEEKAVEDKAAAEAVKAKIDAIGEVNLESEEAIAAARAVYDALTADQKALVDVTALTAAEKKLAELKAAEEKAVEDKAAADAAAKIEDIGEVTLESEEVIKAAREVYDALTAEQKALVSNLDVLNAAEAKLAELKAAAADAERIQAARDVVGKALAAMTVTNDTSKEAIQKTIDEALKKAGITDAAAAVTDVAVTKATTEQVGFAKITVVITSGKGSESTTHTKNIAKLIPPVDPENPQTGDETNLLLPVLLVILSVIGIVAGLAFSRKLSYKGKNLK